MMDKEEYYTSHPPVKHLPSQFAADRVKLICCDIDGTTLTNEHTLHPRTLHAFTLLRAAHPHIPILFATGRPRSATLPLRTALKELGHAGGIYLNGALIASETPPETQDYTTVHETPLRPADAAWYLSFALKTGRACIVYSLDNIYTPKDASIFHICTDADEPYPILTPPDELLRRVQTGEMAVHKVGFLSVPEEIETVRTALFEFEAKMKDEGVTIGPRPADTTVVMQTGPERLEIMHVHATKQHALEIVAREDVGCKMEEVMAFGDGEND
ncbi:hypothetical protein HK104_003692, partial [Borealophlyctis nickersoniae]